MFWGLSFSQRPQWVGCLVADVLERPRAGLIVPGPFWDSFVVVEESLCKILAPAIFVVNMRCALCYGASARLCSHVPGTAEVEIHDVGGRWTMNLMPRVDQDRLVAV